MATATTTYEFKLTHWDGVPADRGETPAPHEVYPFLDAAWDRIGHIRIDATNDLALMRRAAAAIRADASGLKPRVKVVPTDWRS